MKKLSLFIVIALSALLFSTTGVFAKDNEAKLMMAFNESDGTTVEVNILNPEYSAWNNAGNPVDPTSEDAVVIYDKDSNTLTLSGYRYTGIGCYWEITKVSQGYAGIYTENNGTLNIFVAKTSSIELDGTIVDPAKHGHSNGILANQDTSLNITGAANTQLFVQHGVAGNTAGGSAVQADGNLSISGEEEGTPFKLICKGYKYQPNGWDFYGIYSLKANINLKNITMDIESCSNVTGGMSIGICAGGSVNSDILIENCTGSIIGGENVEVSEGIHSGEMAFEGSSKNNNLTIKNSQLKIVARNAYKESDTAKSYAITALRKCVVDGSILELETGTESEASYGLIQSESEESQLIVKNQSEIISSGKDGAIIFWNPEKGSGKGNDIDFSEYGNNLKVMAGLNESEAVLLENPQDCVGYVMHYVHIYAQEDPAPVDPVKPVNPATGLNDNNNAVMIFAGIMLCMAAGCVVLLGKR